MELKVFKGKIKAMGEPSAPVSATQASIATYSYIKMSDGQRINKLVAETGLDGKLREAAIADQEVELHVALHCGETAGLIAIKVGDGPIFATKSTSVPPAKRVWKNAGWIVGVSLIPLLGVGLIILWRTWELSKAIASHDEVHDYVASLPNVTVL